MTTLANLPSNRRYVISCLEIRYPALKALLAAMMIEPIEAYGQNGFADVIVDMLPQEADDIYNKGFHVSEV
jgi:hypothetical protein